MEEILQIVINMIEFVKAAWNEHLNHSIRQAYVHWNQAHAQEYDLITVSMDLLVLYEPF